ncbi:MAG: hypothetical protein ACREA9_00520, partial [Pyrinomonadaceae bacterium]
MTNDEFERIRASILERQAKFTADMDRLREAQELRDAMDTEQDRMIAQRFRGLARTELGMAQSERRHEQFERNLLRLEEKEEENK